MSLTTVVAIAVLGVAALYLISLYNRLVTLRARYRNAFAQIEVQLKRRYDLIPNLVEIARGYLNHERETLEAVIAARNGAVSRLGAAASRPGDSVALAQLASAEGHLQETLGRLNVTIEAYPDLQASQNMQQLSDELGSTENRIAFARQAYNDAVMEYNAYRQSFLPVVLAGAFGHGQDAAMLTFDEAATLQQAPRIAF
jgi:LemA protein